MQESGQFKYPLTALVAANLVPLVGALLFRWDMFSTMAIYWSESVIVAAITVLKMIVCSPNQDEIKQIWRTDYSQWDPVRGAIDQFVDEGCNVARHNVSKIADVPIFTIFMGGACFLYAGLLIAVFGGHYTPTDVINRGFLALIIDQIFEEGLIFAVIGLAISHMISFFRNYIGGGEYRRSVVKALFLAALSRFALLHVALVFGGVMGLATMFVFDSSDSSPMSVFVPVILIVGKTMLDIKLHIR